MSTQYYCKNEGRKTALRNAAVLNGIDYIEVSEDQLTLSVYFVNSPAPTVLAENVLITGGVRITNIEVMQVSFDGEVLEVAVNTSGDFSTYSLELVNVAGLDPRLSSVDFSFKVHCPSDFDCKTETACPPQSFDEPELNYLAKDYSSFRRLMYDRLSVVMPNWRQRSPADLQVALVELLSYVADHLSYYQDLVATEAYLGTARSRISMRRHARLLDYPVHEGCNARVWICLEVTGGSSADGYTLEAGTQFATGSSDKTETIDQEELEDLLGTDDPVVFETMHDVKLHEAHNKIEFYTWSDSDCCLPKGVTSATLLDTGLLLKPGDALVFEETLSPTTGLAADADPTHRHPVRLTSVVSSSDPLDATAVLEIEWHDEDALPFSLCVSSSDKTVSVARGNIVLADHGRTPSDAALDPESPTAGADYRPKLFHADVSFRESYDHEEAADISAASVVTQEPREALPVVHPSDGDTLWTSQRDLLGSDRFATDFVVEVERDRTAYLRFGNDVQGMEPSAGTTFSVTYRIGNGTEGNVGADAIKRIVTSIDGIARVWNPIAAAGGTDPESMDEIRQFAPQAFRTQERAVTEEDYAEVALRHSEVQKAVARFRWTGSWYTVFISIDRKEGKVVDADFEAEMLAHFEKYRLAGYDLEIAGPVYVPLEISMTVCVSSDYHSSEVYADLLAAFGNSEYGDGTKGFFHPDNISFGDTVYLSQIYERAMAVEGVASVRVTIFQRWGETAHGELGDGFLTAGDLEIIRLDNDPNFPENGQIEIIVQGGM